MYKRKVNVLIPAAGEGKRSGLPYPKTLYEIDEKPILLHIIDLVKFFDTEPTIVVNPKGEKKIKHLLNKNSKQFNLVIQTTPMGMGDAILKFEQSPSFDKSSDIFLIWGDVPFIRKETVKEMINVHFKNNNDFTFVTKKVKSAYTLITRDDKQNIIKVEETRETSNIPISGERDIGIFIFKRLQIFNLLKEELPGKYGNKTGEHGFLYIIEHLSKRGFRIEALPIANDKELKSLNSLNDLK